MLKKILMVGLIGLSVSGCATIMDSGNDTISLNTSSGEKVKVVVEDSRGNSQELTLPSHFKVNRDNSVKGRNNVFVKITDKCYEKTQQIISPSITGAYWGNIIAGGPIGSYLDYSNGKMYTYDKEVNITVNKKTGC